MFRERDLSLLQQVVLHTGPLQLKIMKWITLKSKNLPVIALEIDRAIQVFTGLTQKVENSHSQFDLTQLDLLKQDLQKRIHQLDLYYRQHHLDQNISIFHMLRMKLERIVFLSNRKITKSFSLEKKISIQPIDQPLFPESDVKLLEQPLFTYYQNSMKKSKSNQKSSSKITKNEEQIILPSNLKKVEKNNIKMPQKPDKYKVQKLNKFEKGPIPKVSNRQFIKKDVLKAKKEQMQKAINFNTANFGPNNKRSGVATPNFNNQGINPTVLLQQMKNSSELTFTIKMTKQQYRSLLQLKGQIKEPNKI